MLYIGSSELIHPVMESWYPFSNLSLLPHPVPPGTTILLCYFILILDFVLDSPYKWYHPVFVSLCLAYFI